MAYKGQSSTTLLNPAPYQQAAATMKHIQFQQGDCGYNEISMLHVLLCSAVDRRPSKAAFYTDGEPVGEHWK